MFAAPVNFVREVFGLPGLILFVPVYYVTLTVLFSTIILGGIWGSVNLLFWLVLS